MINLIKVKDKVEGNLKAYDILKKIVDKKTLLALSGGTSVDYQKMIVSKADVHPGAICVVDERFGKSWHKVSNEKLLKDQGVFDYAKKKGIEMYKILSGNDILESEKNYDKIIVDLFKKYKKKVGVVGVGANLHTAGIFPYSAAAKSPNYVVAETVEDMFPRRISLTLKALGEFQNFIILMFGLAKQDAARMMLDESENDMQKYPAIFYRKSPAKNWLITDVLS